MFVYYAVSKVSLCLIIKHYTVNMYGGVAPTFLTSALDGDEWLGAHQGHFAPGTHLIRGWVGLTPGREAVQRRRNLCPCQESNTDSSAVRPVA
jgi:hypothetical protein